MKKWTFSTCMLRGLCLQLMVRIALNNKVCVWTGGEKLGGRRKPGSFSMYNSSLTILWFSVSDTVIVKIMNLNKTFFHQGEEKRETENLDLLPALTAIFN